MGNGMPVPRHTRHAVVNHPFIQTRTRRRRRIGRGEANHHVAPLPESRAQELYLTLFLQQDPNAYELMEGQTALHLAALAGRLDLVHYLVLERHVAVDSLNYAGRTALAEVAVTCRNTNNNNNNNQQVVQFLLDHGAAPLCAHADGSTALHYICEQGCTTTVLERVLKHHVNDKTNDDKTTSYLTQREQWTPLHVACRAGHVAVVQTLLCSTNNQTLSSSHLQATDKQGQTPMLLACRENQVQVVQYLLQKRESSTTDIDDENKTNIVDQPLVDALLHHACRHDSLHVVQLLMERYSANPFYAASNTSPWHAAIQESQELNVMYYLLRQHNALAHLPTRE